MWQEFKKFAMRGNVIDLAIGVVIGVAFGAIVASLVKDVIMPPVGWLMGGLDFSDFFFVLKGAHPATLAEAQKLGSITINYGLFINTIINFLIVALALFAVVRGINKLKTPTADTPAEPTEEVVLLRQIRDSLAKR
ncbi:MAG TPA: large conductance mechanosensitive channel protein MscL [Rhizomicrobium sp.]|jgi:large conductance mechanosensitive channel|nr:large conductance mechanosensitive channel protein MscL [Rhizomicrobium sp.]